MKRLIYILMIIALIISCEEIYHPDIDDVDPLLVVEAIFSADEEVNSIYLYQTQNFNNPDATYPRISGATVSVIDDAGTTYNCAETSTGIYTMYGKLDPGRSYHLFIETDGEQYISNQQAVPGKPVLDSVYADRAYKVSVTGTANSSENVKREYGVQMYSDMFQKESVNHYRFYGRKVLQYVDTYDTVIMGMPQTLPIFIWKSIYPRGIFNIAGPPQYSVEKNIIQHPLEFFENTYTKYMPDTMSFAGWIYIIDQYGINEDSYYFYEDMNGQLGAEGRIFDPVYAQLEGNITCESDPQKVVLGNFEITTYTESRYFIIYSSVLEDFEIKEIEYFYDIPLSGYIKDIRPDFWEWMYKNYPDE